MAWIDQLQQASWRGVPFGVLGSTLEVGRKQAVHEYPYRDKPWVEDLGRAKRPVKFQGFLIEDSQVYGGGPVIAQRDAMVAAAETAGTGKLVHPSKGTLTVSLLSLTLAERWDAGRYIELDFSFIESGDAEFPSNTTATAPAVAAAATAADTTAAADFNTTVSALLPAGGLTIASATAAVSSWGDQIATLAGDATSLIHLASQLVGPYGRYFNGANTRAYSGVLGTIFAGAATVRALVADAAAGRALVASTTASELTLMGEVGLPGASPLKVAASAQALVAALLATTADPCDGFRVLSALTAYDSMSPAAIGQAVDTLYQRAAVVALARASMVYQPRSYDDAVAVRLAVTAALDVQIFIAGDAGDDTAFNALRVLRVAVAQDLTARGASLAPLITVISATPLPSLVLAHQLYRDAARSDELVMEAAPVNPLFMPLSFQALAV